jgi:predicted transcriptional regulator
MARGLFTVNEGTPIQECVDELLSRGHSGAPVVDADGCAIGVLSEWDCARLLADSIYDRWPEGPVENYTTKELQTIRAEDDVFVAAGRFHQSKCRRLLVVGDDGELLGLVARRDLLRALQALQREGNLARKTPDTYTLLEKRAGPAGG